MEKANLREAMERERARLMDEAATAIERARALEAKMAKLAEYEQVAAEFNFKLSPNQASTEVPTPGAPPAPENTGPRFAFDGTIASLIDCYRRDERSRYGQLKHNVRSNYDSIFKRLKDDIGSERVADLNAPRIQQIHKENWAARGKFAMGRSVVGKLRLLCAYGSTVLNDDGCTRLSAILRNLRFPVPKTRGERLTADHAKDIREAAHKKHLGSIALAQAFQFDLPQFRQMDIIGEWVPGPEKGLSDITNGNEKWLRGLRWSEIDDNLILRRVLTSGRQDQQKEIEIDLKLCPMIVEELNRVPSRVRAGPIIVCERTRIPWVASEFRRKWRQIATLAGVPKSIRNTDSGRERSVVQVFDTLGALS